MQRRLWIPLMLITSLLVASFLVKSSNNTPAATPAPVEEKMNARCCKTSTECTLNRADSSREMILENLSRQFITIPGYRY